MTFRGTAFLPIWHDIGNGMEPDYERWHTHEHLAERVLTPGMLTGRRYENPQATSYRYFILYEAQSFDVFGSEGYFATANARSAWTQKIDPHFTNFRRAPCHLMMTRGKGVGGALATVRVTLEGEATQDERGLAPRDSFNVSIRPWLEATQKHELVTAVHVGTTGRVERRPLSKTSLSLRPNATAFDAVLLIEGTRACELEVMLPSIEADLKERCPSVQSLESGVYQLSQLLIATAD